MAVATAIEPLFIYPMQLRCIYPHLQHSPAITLYKKYARIKDYLGKQKHQYITVDELSEYNGVDKAAILQRIQ